MAGGGLAIKVIRDGLTHLDMLHGKLKALRHETLCYGQRAEEDALKSQGVEVQIEELMMEVKSLEEKAERAAQKVELYRKKYDEKPNKKHKVDLVGP